MLAAAQMVGGHALLKQAYDKQLRELQTEVEELQRERTKLLQVCAGLGAASRARNRRGGWSNPEVPVARLERVCRERTARVGAD